MMSEIIFTLNGAEKIYAGRADARLLDVLRDECGLTGAKEGCGEGECGSCTVLLDGRPALSCLLLMGQVRGRSVTMVEGLLQRRGFAVLSRCFAEAGAVQCGFCTPGMIVAAYALLRDNRSPAEEQIRAAMAGNLCRCTGYKAIVAAIEMAAADRDGGW